MCELKACAMIPDCFNFSILPNYIPPALHSTGGQVANIDITKIKFSSSKTQEPHQYQDQVNDCTRWRMQLPPPLNFVQVSCELSVQRVQSRILCNMDILQW